MKFDSVYEGLLYELFTTRSGDEEWVWDDNNWKTFIPGPKDINYLINLVHFWDIDLPPSFFDEDSFITPEMARQLHKQASHSWIVEFGSDTEQEEMTGITGEQGMEASKVFSIVGNAIIGKVKQDPNSFKNLVFSAKEPSRRSLYARLAPILAKKLGKDLVTSPDGEWFFLMSK